MALNIGSLSKYPNQLTVWEVEDKGSLATGKVSSSRKDKRLPEGKQWINSSWFVKFVGTAYSKIDELSKGTRIEILNGVIAQEPYEKDGEKLYPKSPQITVFDFSVLGQSEGGKVNTGLDRTPAVENDDDIPF
jgi:hypothetical protein